MTRDDDDEDEEFDDAAVQLSITRLRCRRWERAHVQTVGSNR